MNVAEFQDALKSAPRDSAVSVRLATGEVCPISALHVGAGGDAAGTVTLECAPQVGDTYPEGDESMGGSGNMDDDIDEMAAKAGVDTGKPKSKAKTPPKKAAADEEDAAE